jgi:antitoxin ParD1/3/4
MNVSLTPEFEKKIEEKIASGLYSSASEVVREALRLLFQADAAREREIDLMNRRIKLGIEQLDRGEGIPGDEARRRSNRRLSERRRG